MRITPRRVLWTFGLIGFFFLILRFFPGLPFLALSGSGFGGLRSDIRWLWNLAKDPSRWFSKETAARGAWLRKLETGADNYQHIEYYCEAPKLNLSLDSDEVLHGMQILIRHGDRGALFDVKEASHLSCPYDDGYSEPEVLHSYYDLTAAMKRDKLAHEFQFVPQKTGCYNGQLTSKGVLQHLELGEAVKKRLGEKAAQWVSSDTEVHSTSYPRTYQSALAFMHGLDPSTRDSARTVHIAPEHDTQFCTVAGTCRCTANPAFMEEYIQVKMDYFVKDTKSIALTKQLREILLNHVDEALRVWAPHVFDVLLQFACHGKNMPCFDGKCVTYQELVQIIDILEKLAEKLSSEPAVRRFSVVEGYGFLQKMVDNLQAAEEKQFILFSAHDSTIVPVIHSLGLPFKIVIPYASHIIFEIYSLKSSSDQNDRFIRIIYNGEDVTLRTLFAPRCGYSKNRCLFSVFREFVETDLKTEYGVACPR